jgi:hypothetical protein
MTPVHHEWALRNGVAKRSLWRATLFVRAPVPSPSCPAFALLGWMVSRMAASENLSGYSVQAEPPESGTAIGESYANMPAAIARAVELIREGYTVEIFSASSVAPR